MGGGLRRVDGGVIVDLRIEAICGVQPLGTRSYGVGLGVELRLGGLETLEFVEGVAVGALGSVDAALEAGEGFSSMRSKDPPREVWWTWLRMPSCQSSARCGERGEGAIRNR
jgi:hypothetical protein